ncbi:hypothetical protein IWX49DRAFT_221474 [Phyllosticta citricarpa]|uniref:Uncharacterized protein n=1 Tax=Phyllosticta citricarpa TaxID=55181 RepID=A0ABR1MNP9_9PEZI
MDMPVSKPSRNHPQSGTALGFAMPPSPPAEMTNNYDAVRLNQYLPEIRSLQQAQQAKFSQQTSYLDNATHLEKQGCAASEQARGLQNGPGAFNPYEDQYRKYSAPSEQSRRIRNGPAISALQQARRIPDSQTQYFQDAGKLLDHGIQAEVESVTKSLNPFKISPPYNESADNRNHAESFGSIDYPQYSEQHLRRIVHQQTPQRGYDPIASGLKARLTQMHADEVASMPRKNSTPTQSIQVPTPQSMTTQDLQRLRRSRATQYLEGVQSMQGTQPVPGAQQIQDPQHFQVAQHAAHAHDFSHSQDLSYARDNTYARDVSYTPSTLNVQLSKHGESNQTIQKPFERRGAIDLGRNVPQSAPFTPEPSQSVVTYNSDEVNDTQYGGGHTSSRVWVSDRCRQEEQYEVAQIGVRRNFRKYDKDIMEPIKDFGSWLRHQSAMHNVKLEAERRKIAEMEQRALVREKDKEAQMAGVPFWDLRDRQPGHGAALGMPTIWCPDWKTPDRRVAAWPTLSEMKWEGDDRARTGVKRFLPLPREPTNGAVAWNHLPMIHQQPFDQVWTIPTELDILYPMHQLDEEAERDRHRLLPPDLIDAIEPGPRDVYGKGDLDPKHAVQPETYVIPQPPLPPRPHFVYPHKM